MFRWVEYDPPYTATTIEWGDDQIMTIKKHSDLILAIFVVTLLTGVALISALGTCWYRYSSNNEVQKLFKSVGKPVVVQLGKIRLNGGYQNTPVRGILDDVSYVLNDKGCFVNLEISVREIETIAIAGDQVVKGVTNGCYKLMPDEIRYVTVIEPE